MSIYYEAACGHSKEIGGECDSCKDLRDEAIKDAVREVLQEWARCQNEGITSVFSDLMMKLKEKFEEGDSDDRR